MPDPVLCSLLRLNRLRLKTLRQSLVLYGYRAGMHMVVQYVGRNPGASQEDIAAFYAADKTNVARDARRLEEMGHIRRSIHPENRRKYQLYLTAEGEKMLCVITKLYESFAQKLAEGMSPEEWARLQEVLQQLEKNATE